MHQVAKASRPMNQHKSLCAPRRCVMTETEMTASDVEVLRRR